MLTVSLKIDFCDVTINDLRFAFGGPAIHRSVSGFARVAEKDGACDPR
jgi:hypothetical protein